MHLCTRCGKSFSQKSGLKRHQNRKRPCRQANQSKYQCMYCGTNFKHYQSRWRHEKNCKKKKSSESLDDLIKLVKDQNTLHKEEKATWEKEKKELKSCIHKILDKLATPTNITNNYIVQINNFGNENTSYIQTKLLQQLLKTPTNAVPELIKQIHFHPDHPENRNIKITNRKERFAHVFKDQEWQLARKDEILDYMVESGFTLLDTCFEQSEDNLSDGKKKHYQKFQEKMDQQDSKTRKRVTQDTEMMVLNQSKK